MVRRNITRAHIPKEVEISGLSQEGGGEKDLSNGGRGKKR